MSIPLQADGVTTATIFSGLWGSGCFLDISFNCTLIGLRSCDLVTWVFTDIEDRSIIFVTMVVNMYVDPGTICQTVHINKLQQIGAYHTMIAMNHSKDSSNLLQSKIHILLKNFNGRVKDCIQKLLLVN